MQLSIPLLSTYYMIKETKRTEENYSNLLKDLPLLNKINTIQNCLIEEKKYEHEQLTFEKYKHFYEACRERDSVLNSAWLPSLNRLVLGVAFLILFPTSFPIALCCFAIASEAMFQNAYVLWQSRQMKWHATHYHPEGLNFFYVNNPNLSRGDGTV